MISPEKWITGRRPDVFPALVEYADGTQHIWNVDGQFFVVIRWQPWVNVPPPLVPKTQEELDFENVVQALTRCFPFQLKLEFNDEEKAFYREILAYVRESERKRFVQLVTNLANRYHDVRDELIAIAKGEKP